MAKCVVHFDQIEIVTKKSDPAHADNDWLIVHWFVGSGRAGLTRPYVTAFHLVSDSGLSYDPATDRYKYVWKTDQRWAHTCRQFVLGLKDGTFRRANFHFR